MSMVKAGVNSAKTGRVKDSAETSGHQAEDCVMSFLMGLNETYTTVRGQILLMDPTPPMGKVFSLLIQDEKQRKIGKKNTIESSALAVKTNGQGRVLPWLNGWNCGCGALFLNL